ncbi:MAG: agmatine deiminase family protein [Gammaproteobacteria bacterium]|jgi:agmatine deiminase
MSNESTTLTIPAEWSHHKVLWTAWPSHETLWQENLAGAREEVANMVRALASGEPIRVLACGDEAMASATAAIGYEAEILPARFGDIWLRDTGPIFALTAQGSIALRFRNNGWGGKYRLPGDDSVGDEVAKAAGVEPLHFDFVLEGGALEHNGNGVVLTTRQCLLNPNRNGDWSQARAEQALQQALNCKQVLWLEDGLLNDHTDGHVDNLARFVDSNSVVCQSASGRSDPNAGLYDTLYKALRGMGLNVHQIPSPGRIDDTEGEPMPASHMNFIIGNETVVMPVYEDHYSPQAVADLQRLFPRHKVVGLPSRHLLTGGGSFHCITQQEPEL